MYEYIVCFIILLYKSRICIILQHTSLKYCIFKRQKPKHRNSYLNKRRYAHLEYNTATDRSKVQQNLGNALIRAGGIAHW